MPNLTQQVAQRIPDVLSLGSIKRLLGRQYGAERQRFAVWLGLGSITQQHRKHARFPDCESFCCDWLREGFHTSDRSYNRLLARLYDYPAKGRGGYSANQGWTKAYSQRAVFAAACRNALDTDASAPVIDIEMGDTVHLAAADNGLAQCDLPDLFVPAVLPISLEHVNAAINLARSKDRNQPFEPRRRGWSIGSVLDLLLATRMWVRGLGGLPNLYVKQSHGRLGPAGFSVHIVSMPRRVRHQLLAGSGLVDFDVVCCVPSLFISLGRAMGFETTTVEQYVGDRANVFNVWQRVTDHADHDDFKCVVLSLFTGGTLNPDKPWAESTRRLGRDAVVKLASDSFAGALVHEIQTGMKVVVAHLQCNKWRNAVGAVLESTKRRSFSKASAHALFGFEQLAIQATCQHATGLQAIVFDGFIAQPQEVEPLNTAIRETSVARCGFALDLTLKATPFDAPAARVRNGSLIP
jgi:hypothetical protein